MIDKGLKQTVH